MGLSKELFTNTYQLYKSYTNDICRWLISASDYGANPPVQIKSSTPSNTPAEVRAPRLKGKARKLAKSTPGGSAAGTKPAPTKSGPDSGETKMTSVDQMIHMAEAIAAKPDKISAIPKLIVVKLEKTIMLRSQFLSLYAIKPTENADEGRERKNDTHTYFVRVLERVLAILKPSQPSKPNAEDAPESDSAESSKTSKIAQTINNFHVLDIDEVEEEDGDADTTPPLVFPTKPRQNQKPTREEMLPEILFATFCFFSDLDALKYSLCDHWKQYRERKISLDTVTLMTNMGIAAIQRAEEQFIETFADYLPANPSYFDIAPPLFHTLFKDFTDDRLNPDGYTYNFRGEELLRLKYVDDLMCRTTASTLTTRALSSEFCKLDKDDDWCLDRSKMPFSAIVGINREILNHITAECDVLESMGFDYGQDDPLTHGLRKLCRSQFKIPISIGLVFSAQMVICANSILGTAGTRPFEDMQAAARRADALISKYEEAGLHQADRTSPETSGVVQSFVDLIRNFMLDDAIAKMKVEVLSKFQHNAKATLPTRPFHFFKFNPLACGNRLLALEVFLKGWSAPTAQNYLTCIQTAHLYHMFRLMTPLDVRWPEMDSFLSLHSTDALFAGKVPTTMAECLTSYILVIGKRIAGKPDPASGKFPKLQSLPKGKKKWLVFSPTFEALANWAHQIREPCPKRNSRLLECLMAANESRLPRSRGQSQIGLVEQILSVKALFEAELPYLQFDYLSLHIHSRALFAKLDQELKHDLKRIKANQDGEHRIISSIMIVGSTMHEMLKIRYQERVVPDHFDPITDGVKVFKNFLLEHHLGEKAEPFINE